MYKSEKLFDLVKKYPNALVEFGNSLLAILLALLIGALLIFLIGESPLEAYTALIIGSLGSPLVIANTLSKAVPLAFTGFAVALSVRCGMLNIGSEGQLYMGAMASTLCALWLNWLPGYLLIPLCLLVGFLAGMMAGFVPGFFKAKYKISEVIVSIMMNYILKFFTAYLAIGPFKAEGHIAQTEIIPSAAHLTQLVPNSQLTAGIFIMILTGVILYIFLWHTSPGFKIRAVGSNPTAARAAGINVNFYIMITMMLSGGIAAFAGITEVMGKYHRFIDGFSPSFGFTGIAVAILGRNHPVGVILTALLFGIMDNGVLRMSRVTNISSNMVTVIQALVILLVAAPEIIGLLRRKWSLKWK